MVEVVQVRDGLDSDVGWILDLGAALFEDLGDYREILGHWLALPRTRILIAELEGASVGFALISPGRSIGFLWRPWAELVGIGVLPQYRGRGVGRRLMGTVVEVADQWRAREVRLHTAGSNHRGQAFFDRHGFRSVASDGSVYPSGETAVSMVRSLPAGRTDSAS